MRDVVIVSAVRTAIGSLGGGLKGVSAVTLGSVAAREAIRRAGIDPAIIDEAMIGNVLCYVIKTMFYLCIRWCL